MIFATVPENQIHFPGTNSADGSHTTWTDSDYYWGQYAGGGYGVFQDRQIRPVPEPSTYGAIFLASALALLGYRRHRRHSFRHHSARA